MPPVASTWLAHGCRKTQRTTITIYLIDAYSYHDLGLFHSPNGELDAKVSTCMACNNGEYLCIKAICNVLQSRSSTYGHRLVKTEDP